MPTLGNFLTADINAKNARTAGSFISLLALFLTGGCSRMEYDHTKKHTISGQVISEEFKEDNSGPYRAEYHFSVQTDNGVKELIVIGKNWLKSRFDSLIDKGDEVELLLKGDSKYSSFYLKTLNHIIKINNEYYHTVSGKIKGENLNVDKYVFTINTEDGLKTFDCKGEQSKQLEELLKKDDEVTIKIFYWQNTNDQVFYVQSISQILELNGERQK